MARLSRALELCNTGDVGTGFLSGVVGVAWALASMPTRLDANDLEDVFATVDELVCSQLDDDPRVGCYELGDGDAGLVLFALRRVPRPAARHALRRFVARLEETAEVAAGGLAWRVATSSYADLALPANVQVFVLGRAHGISGVIGPLAYTMRAGVEVERCRRLMAGAVRFLLAPPDKLALIREMDEVLGLGVETFRRPSIPDELHAKIRDREAARAARQWIVADAIRDELAAQGIQLMDTADGTDWYRAVQ